MLGGIETIVAASGLCFLMVLREGNGCQKDVWQAPWGEASLKREMLSLLVAVWQLSGVYQSDNST